MMYYQDARAAGRTARWLPRLIFCCRDLPDILKFVQVAARSVAPAACFYGPAGCLSASRAGHADVGIDMGLVSVDQAMMEAEFAAEVCADLSLACAIDVDPDARTAWAGPGASYSDLLEACRKEHMIPCFDSPPFPGARRHTLLSALRRDCTPLARVQRVSLCGHVQWLTLHGEPEMLELLCSGPADAGIISRFELRLQPATDGQSALSPGRQEGSDQ